MVRKMMRSGRVTRLRAFYTIGDRFPCLCTGNGSTFNLAGGRSYELIGRPSDVNLAPHVGHKIDVTGAAVAANRAAKAEGVKGAAKKVERGERHLQVQSFRMIAGSCP